jgi:hypothetical protein
LVVRLQALIVIFPLTAVGGVTGTSGLLLFD